MQVRPGVHPRTGKKPPCRSSSGGINLAKVQPDDRLTGHLRHPSTSWEYQCYLPIHTVQGRISCQIHRFPKSRSLCWSSLHNSVIVCIRKSIDIIPSAKKVSKKRYKMKKWSETLGTKERPRNVDLSMLYCSCGDCHLHVTLLSDVGRQILVLLRSSASWMGFCWICVALLHVFLQFEWWISSFSAYGHRVFDTVQLTEGRPPGPKQPFCFVCFGFVSVFVLFLDIQSFAHSPALQQLEISWPTNATS